MNELSENKIIYQLLRDPYLNKEKRIFDELTGERTTWWIGNKGFEKNSIFPLRIEKIPCIFLEKTSCKFWFERLLKSDKKIERCPQHFKIISFPIYIDHKPSFYFYICHLNKEPSSLAIECLRLSLNLLVDRIKKNEELEEIYETVKPRAIALSTVHTVHRIIASTLNLEELLPRIARLSLQVLRAIKCVVTIIDPVKKKIIPKVYLNLEQKKITPQKISTLRLNYEKRVVNSLRILMKKNCLCIPLIDQDIIGTIRVENKQNKEPFNNADKEILTVLGEQAVVAIKNAQLYEERGRILLGSIKSLAALLDIRLPAIYTHPMGFVEIVLELGKELKLSEEDMEALKYAALLLDAGKISIPDEILMKPSKLTGKEYSIIKEHPIKSAEIVGTIDAMKPAIPFIIHHHERYDGKGYPMGLKKNEIPLGARIIALADAFEAMICKRPYRGKSLSFEEAIKEIKKASGTQFDPSVVRAFLKIVREKRIKNIICKMSAK